MMATTRGSARDPGPETDADALRLITLGAVAGVYGVRGWIKVRSSAASPESILDYPVWWLKSAQGWRRWALEQGRVQGNRIVAKLQGCDDRDVAAALMGMEIAIPRAELPATEADEFYWMDLEGLTVENLQGVVLGRVAYLFETGSNDVMVVQGDRERLVPFTEQAVIRVELAEGRILVDWDPDF